MEAFLRAYLPRLLSGSITFEVYSYQGKSDLLKKLPDRLRGYRSWLPEDWRVVVVLDKDDDQAEALKTSVQWHAEVLGFRVRRIDGSNWQLLTRIVVEELESWYFGDWPAVTCCYPGVSKSVPAKAAFRDTDSIQGGTWEAFERVLKKAGYFSGGLRKIEAARLLGSCMSTSENRSRSWSAFTSALLEAGQNSPGD